MWEGENKAGYITGFTQNYVKVKTFWNPELINTIQEVTLKEIDEDGLVKVDVNSSAKLSTLQEGAESHAAHTD